MISMGKPLNGIELPIVKLVPRNERDVGKKYLQRIEASLRAVGLIEPLIVYRGAMPQATTTSLAEHLMGSLGKRLDLVSAVAPIQSSPMTARVGNRSLRPTVSGSTEMGNEVRTSNLVAGRYFNRSESDAGSRVAIIGDTVKNELFANVSSATLYRFAPVLDALTVTRPALSVIRFPDRKYNWQDLVEEYVLAPSEGPPPRFAVYNIRVQDGSIRFDDRLVGRQHEVGALVVEVPFLSNLASAIDVSSSPSSRGQGSTFDHAGEKCSNKRGLRREASSLYHVSITLYGTVKLNLWHWAQKFSDFWC